MRTLVLSLFASALCCSVSFAQESAPASDGPHAATPKPVRRATVVKAAPATPAPTPASHKPGFFERVFHGKATPAPAGSATLLNPDAATATPHPRTRPRKPPGETEEGAKPEEGKTPPAKEGTGETKPADGSAAPETGNPPAPEKTAPAETPDAKVQPEHKEGEATPTPPPPAATPAPGKRGHNKKGTPPAEVKPKDAGKEPTKEEAAVQQAIASGDPDAIEKAKYDEVKSRASADPAVVELKQKADNATTEEEGRKELREYNKALFKKMRSLGDQSVQDRITRMEKAVSKDLGD